MIIFSLNSRVTLIIKAAFIACIVGCNEPSTNDKVYSYLKKAAESASKSCPVQVDSILRLENVTALPPSTLRYNYTLKFDTVKYDLGSFKRDLTKTTRNSVKTSPDGQPFRRLFATFEYNYQDTLGNFLFRIIIPPDDYIK